MNKYIDAEKLITEFQRRLKICDNVATDERNALDTKDWYRGKGTAYSEVIHFIKLQQEQPLLPDNLDDAAFNYAELCKYEDADKLLCAEHFKAGAKWMASRVQPEGDLEKEVKSYIKDNFTITDEVDQIPEEDRMYSMGQDDMVAFAKHFYELGKNSK